MNSGPMQPDENADQEIEARLRRYTLSAPDAGLWDAIVTRATTPPKASRTDRALGWAVAALVVVQVWGGWMERQTGNRMAQLGAPQPNTPTIEAKPGGLRAFGQEVELAILHPRYRLPLGPGVHSTRIQGGRIPITSITIGEVS